MEEKDLEILDMKEGLGRLEALGIPAEARQQAVTISACVVSKISST